MRRVGVSVTTSPLHGEGKKSEDVRTPATLVVCRTALLLGHVLA